MLANNSSRVSAFEFHLKKNKKQKTKKQKTKGEFHSSGDFTRISLRTERANWPSADPLVPVAVCTCAWGLVAVGHVGRKGAEGLKGWEEEQI